LNPNPLVEDIVTDLERRLRDAGKTALKMEDDESTLYFHATGERDAYSVAVEVIKRKAGNSKFRKICEMYELEPGDKFMLYKRADDIWVRSDKEYLFPDDPDGPLDMKMDPGWGDYNFCGILCVNLVSGEHRVFTCGAENSLVQKVTSMDILRVLEKSEKDLDKSNYEGIM
jgi:hypothetical protein